MRRGLMAIALAGCGAPSRPAPIANTSTPPARPKTEQRARVTRYSMAWVRLSDPPIQRDTPEAADDVWPIADSTRDKVRVRIEHDGARLALWMPRADLSPVIVRASELAIDGAPHGTGVGVTVQPGTRVRAHQLGHVTVSGDALVATGDVAADAVGDLWTPAAPAPKLDPTMEIFDGDVVRAAPDANAIVLAKAIGAVNARELHAASGWTEIVAGGDEIVVHGFIPTPPAGDYGSDVGVGSGEAYGMSDTDRVDVPAGACLYDARNGEVIGKELEPMTRYAFHTDDPSWWNVYVGTPWDTALVAYRVGVTCP